MRSWIRGSGTREEPMANGGDSIQVDVSQPSIGGGALGAAGPAVEPVAGRRGESPLVQAMRRLGKSTTALAGLVIVAILVLVAIFADVLRPDSPARRRPHTN